MFMMVLCTKILANQGTSYRARKTSPFLGTLTELP